MAVKNLGNALGIIKGTTPPSNTEILWFDENSGVASKDRIKFYNSQSSAWESLAATASAALSSDVTANGIQDDTIGIDDGETISAGTEIQQIVERLLIRTVPPTYTDPTLTLSGSGNKNIEAGQNISPTLDPHFTQNDAGSLTEIRFYQDGSVIQTQSGQSNYSVSSFQIGDEQIDYDAEADYDEGSVKNDNTGSPSPGGQISAGTISSNVVTYRGQRNLWWEAQSSTFTVSSSNVRALSNNQLNPSNGTTFTINIPVGTESVIFAYPDTLRDVDSVIYVEGANSEVKGNFTKNNENVDGANGFTAIGYKVYVYEPVEPFQTAATYEVTI